MLGCYFMGLSTAVGPGRFRGPADHSLMIPHHRRTDELAGKKPSRDSEPTVALRASSDTPTLLRGCLWPHLGWIGFHAAANYSPFTERRSPSARERLLPFDIRRQVGPVVQGYHAQPFPSCSGINSSRDAAHR
jgi:hypothetical protein